jgi:predicted acylesterase/phospholipase RssA
MGAIASSSDPRALELFRKVLLASASIPGIFSPVMIDVELDGKRMQEMHVDGGAMRQVFLLPRLYFQGLKDQGRYEQRERHVFVIRNGRIDPQWAPTVRRSTSVARRALEALIDEQGISDVRHLYNAAQQDGEDFNLAYIDDGFDYPHPEEFSRDYMGHLFDYAYHQGQKGYPWRKSPPQEAY